MKNMMMSTTKPIRIGFDVDEVLLECSEPARIWANEKLGTNLKKNDLNVWGRCDGDFKKLQTVFRDETFVASQEPIEGAVEFIKRLSAVEGVEIYFITAVPVEMTKARSLSLVRHFPWVPTENYILTSSKHVAHFDIFVDDAEHNLFSNESKYPIVKRERWNENITGMLSYQTFEELWSLIEIICKKEGLKKVNKINTPSILAIIGPTGSDKNKLANELCKRGMSRPWVYTNSHYDLSSESYKYYSYRTDEEIREEEDFFMTTVYGKNFYGVKYKNIKTLLDRHDNLVMVVDMRGYAALKTKFPTVSIYKDQTYEKCISNTLKKEMSDEEKTNRIMAIKRERRNMELCDYVLPASDDIEMLADMVMNTIRRY